VKPVLRFVRDAAIFAPCYVALDWASYLAPLGPFNITPWNPQPALAIAWMVLGGLHHAPVVLATVFVADVLVRQAPAGYLITLATSAALAGSYLAMAWTLRALPQFDFRLRSTRDLTWFTTVVIAGAALGGACYVGILTAAGLLSQTAFIEGWLRFSLGDAVGILVTAPLLFAAADTSLRRRLLAFFRRGEAVAQGVLLVAALWLVFAGLPGHPAWHFYVLFVPLIWIAVRGGMGGAVIAIVTVQLGVVLGIHRGGPAELPVVELQALVATLTLAGLYLGVLVDERERAADAYRQTLRLAAAGEMAGAIAHEVNQPLTAIANYGQAALTMLERGDSGAVPETLVKILAQSRRASEVVRRLRDFFRTGDTRLEPLPVPELLDAIRRIGRQVIGAREIDLEVGADEGLAPLFVDRVQVELIVRNLLANAMDAVHAPGLPEALIRVYAAQHGRDHVRVVVSDNGPGLAPDIRERVFEPFVSGKSSGLGLGLAISRAIAEAHGGSLKVGAADHGEFELVLPCVQSR
jgi:two-component system sensor kinase FixL